MNNEKRIPVLKQKYRKLLESSLMLSLLIVAFLFYSFKSFKHENKLPVITIDEFEVINIPQTIQNQPKPRPPLPAIPIEVEEDDLEGDEIVEFPDLKYLASLGDPPSPPVDEPDVYVYEIVQEKPVLLKHAQPYYPHIAVQAGIEGTVVVKVLIDKKGYVEKTEVLKSIPVLDEAALEAAMKCIFKPAKQRDKFVKVWMSIPFKFKLK